jgi:capsular polysaccharide biosynthesis protein/cellulose biosynthesis protein BcsQ
MDISNQASQPDHLKHSSYEGKEQRESKEYRKPLLKKIDSEDFRELYDIKKLTLGAQRHSFLITLCMLIFALFGVYFSYIFQTSYQAEAVVLYQKEEGASKNIEGGFTITNLSLPTVLDMIKLPGNFDAVKTTLGLDLDPSELDSMVRVPIPKNESNLIRIVARANNPNLAIDIANGIAKVAVKSSQDFNRRQFKIALDGYEEQLAVMRRKMGAQIKKIEDFKIENQYFDMNPAESSFILKVEDARKELVKAELEYNTYQVQYENLKRELENLPKFIPMTLESKDNPLQQRIISLQTTLAEARAKYTKGNPKLQHLENELSDLLRHSNENPGESDEKFLQKNETRGTLEVELMHLQGKVRSAQKVKEEMTNHVNNLELELLKLPVQQMAFVKLYQAQDVTKEQLKDVNKAVEGAKLMVNVPKGSIELYQLATEAKPWKEGLWVDLMPLLGLLFGFGVGFMGAIFLEVLDQKIRTAKQIEMFYNIPCLGSIPELSRLTKKTAEKKTLFFIRNLIEQLDKQPKRINSKSSTIIAFTSSVEREGKSLIATFTADYYTKMGHKVLLMEMDYRVNPFTESPNPVPPSIAESLKGNASIEDVIIPGHYNRIKLTQKEPGMKELLKSKEAVALWSHLKSKYEIIIIDIPGVIQEDYSTNLLEASDLGVFIIGSSIVSKNTVDESLNVLDSSSSRPAGILLNRIDHAYISHERILFETRRSRDSLWKKLQFWRSE